MALTAHEKAIKSGVRMNGRIGDLFAKAGTSAHPRGEITTIYRRTRVELESALQADNPVLSTRDVLQRTRRDLLIAIGLLYASAVTLGEEEALRQLELYGVSSFGSINLTSEAQSATDAVMARFDAQAAAILALVATGAQNEQIIGDGNSNGIFSYSEITVGIAYWIAYLVWYAFDSKIFGTQAVGGGRQVTPFQKQAIAVIDERTTECCLKVHGQIQPLDGMFKLVGQPRFADEMDRPGFHNFCRTSMILYSAEFDNGNTAKLIEEAKKFMKK